MAGPGGVPDTGDGNRRFQQRKIPQGGWQRRLQGVEAPLIVDSVRKHGIADDDVPHAFHHPVSVEDLDEGLKVIIGPSRSAQLLEVGVIDTDHGPVIVHAMNARKKYARR